MLYLFFCPACYHQEFVCLKCQKTVAKLFMRFGDIFISFIAERKSEVNEACRNYFIALNIYNNVFRLDISVQMLNL